MPNRCNKAYLLTISLYQVPHIAKHPIHLRQRTFGLEERKRFILLSKRLVLGEEGRDVRVKPPMLSQAHIKLGCGNTVLTTCRDLGGRRSPLQGGISGCRNGMLRDTRRRTYCKLAATGRIRLSSRGCV